MSVPSLSDGPMTGAVISIGEIVAWRFWRLLDDTPRLISTYLPFEWHPGQAMTGNVAEHGVYAIKSPEYVRRYFQQIVGPYPMAVGRVKLWGDMVEHSWGWRASYAKPLTIDCIGASELRPNLITPSCEQLRQRYGLEKYSADPNDAKLIAATQPAPDLCSVSYEDLLPQMGPQFRRFHAFRVLFPNIFGNPGA